MAISTNEGISGGSPLLGKHFTSTPDKNPRLRVDVAQTGFFEGREFRSFYEYSLAAGASFVIKFTAVAEFILFEQSLTVEGGSIRFTAVTGGTEGGSFSTSLPVIGKNRMLERPTPLYTAVNSLATGGTYTGGTVVEVVRLISASATAQQTTVGGTAVDERGLPVGTYFLKFENIGSGTIAGVYTLFWEERE